MSMCTKCFNSLKTSKILEWSHVALWHNNSI